MKILITGATGFIGKNLVNKLLSMGMTDINVLTRDVSKAKKVLPAFISFYQWDSNKSYLDINSLKDVKVIIHLAGENIANGRWSNKNKSKIMGSRKNYTALLIESLNQLNNDFKVKLITASAIGFYGDRGDSVVDESSTPGNDFLSKTCELLEQEIHKVDKSKVDAKILRIGLVLGLDGGALNKMLPAFKLCLGGRLGNGTQYMSWIHIDDLILQIIFLINNNTKNTIYNACAPFPITNELFTTLLTKSLRRITIFNIPAFFLKIALGEMSSILLSGQKVNPKNFIDDGFKYSYTHLEKALDDLIETDKKSLKTLTRYQLVPKDISEVFSFFSDEKNLERITPKYLHFKIKEKSTDKIRKGTVITYNLKLHGIPFRWKSLISEFEKEKYFVDSQLKGPYAKWVHLHEFIPVKGNTLIRDYIEYKAPFWKLGELLASSYLKKDLNKIFNYRYEVIEQYFKGNK